MQRPLGLPPLWGVVSRRLTEGGNSTIIDENGPLRMTIFEGNLKIIGRIFLDGGKQGWYNTISWR